MNREPHDSFMNYVVVVCRINEKEKLLGVLHYVCYMQTGIKTKLWWNNFVSKYTAWLVVHSRK